MSKSILKVCIGVLIGWVLAACSTGSVSPPPADIETSDREVPVVEVIAEGMTFIAPDQVPSGWVTFRFKNNSPMEHFAVVQRPPDGYGVADQQREVAPIFQQGMDLINAGKATEATAKFGELPAWFGDIVFLGGPGMLSQGQVSDATVYLEPGTHMLECYVKTGGLFHSVSLLAGVNGMVHQFEVTNESSGLDEPEASIHVQVSREEGFNISGTPRAGRNIVSVHYLDQGPHEHFLGHDVHVARIPQGLDLTELERWMSWAEPRGFETPAPVVFLGGTEEAPAGHTVYFTVDLDPGQHAWVAEVPGAIAKNMLQIFEVK